jgi:hypothetical protein
VIARRVEQGHAVDRLGGARHADRIAERFQGQLVAAGRLGRLRQPVIVRGLVGGQRDLVAVALDQAAVLAEDDQGVGLGDDQ